MIYIPDELALADIELAILDMLELETPPLDAELTATEELALITLDLLMLE
ncbi:MAG: hypothetical protein HW401_173, partial [Parcubacteria group bacterium]|nr:hypothetical protein [Parcubacteria group bacterium]